MELYHEIEDRVNWIKAVVSNAEASGIVVGLSGGLDSAVTAELCRKAVGTNLQGLILPCESNPKDEEDAIRVAEWFGIRYSSVDLTEAYYELEYNLPNIKLDFAKGQGNLKARLRMIALYWYANHMDALVAGTGNKSEFAIGYFTKYGDGGADFFPIADIYKSDLIEYAMELRVPEEIIYKPPSAGLWEGQSDEDEIGMSYKELDEILKGYEQGAPAPISGDKLIRWGKVMGMVLNSKQKRLPAPMYGLTWR